jgi:antitoxin MazE
MNNRNGEKLAGVDLHVSGGRDPGLAGKPSIREILARLRRFRGRLSADFRFVRKDA